VRSSALHSLRAFECYSYLALTAVHPHVCCCFHLQGVVLSAQQRAAQPLEQPSWQTLILPSLMLVSCCCFCRLRSMQGVVISALHSLRAFECYPSPLSLVCILTSAVTFVCRVWSSVRSRVLHSLWSSPAGDLVPAVTRVGVLLLFLQPAISAGCGKQCAVACCTASWHENGPPPLLSHCYASSLVLLLVSAGCGPQCAAACCTASGAAQLGIWFLWSLMLVSWCCFYRLRSLQVVAIIARQRAVQRPGLWNGIPSPLSYC
jgi:hypothetical protein